MVNGVPQCPVYRLAPDVAALCLAYLGEEDLKSVELAGKAFFQCIGQKNVWRRNFEVRAARDGWCVPQNPPAVGWKVYTSRYHKEVMVQMKEKIQAAAVCCYWRVVLGDGRCKRKSRIFPFSKDALGGDIQWQLELETQGDTGHLRMWTTNPWTHQTTSHYFGSHCTVTLRDQHNNENLTPETFVDIDGAECFTFKKPVSDKEVVFRINLTLALEVNSALHPFYSLISTQNAVDTDVVKIGYCKSIFEIAKYKRKHAATFVARADRDLTPLIEVLLSPKTSAILRIEVYQALFNMLGPGCVLLEGGHVEKLLLGCESHLKAVDRGEGGLVVQLAQNVLGNVFNLLIHPTAKEVFSQRGSRTAFRIARVLRNPTLGICHFSSLVVLLTMHAWKVLPPSLFPPLVNALAGFMETVDPLNFEMTGVAWDETDIASFFIPLLRSGDRICVAFVSWCLGHFYFAGSSGGRP